VVRVRVRVRLGLGLGLGLGSGSAFKKDRCHFGKERVLHARAEIFQHFFRELLQKLTKPNRRQRNTVKM
jgi:hypothetical protein